MWWSHKNFSIQFFFFFFGFCSVKLKDHCDSYTLAYSETAIPQSKAQLLRWNASSRHPWENGADINNCSQPFHLCWSCALGVPPVPCEQGVVTVIFSLWLVWPWVIWVIRNSVNYPTSATCFKLLITCITLTVRVRSYFCYSCFCVGH